MAKVVALLPPLAPNEGNSNLYILFNYLYAFIDANEFLPSFKPTNTNKTINLESLISVCKSYLFYLFL